MNALKEIIRNTIRESIDITEEDIKRALDRVDIEYLVAEAVEKQLPAAIEHMIQDEIDYIVDDAIDGLLS